MALGHYLRCVGFEVEQVNDSSQALEVALAFRPDVVILDYQMPGLNGAEVAWEFACDPVLQSVPILICSGYADTISRTEFPPKEISIVLKPFDAAEVARWVRQHAAAVA